MDKRKDYKRTRTQKKVRTQVEGDKDDFPNDGANIMGGRNEQASLRTRSPNARS